LLLSLVAVSGFAAAFLALASPSRSAPSAPAVTHGEVSLGSCVLPDTTQAEAHGAARPRGISGPFPLAGPLQTRFIYRVIGFNLAPSVPTRAVIVTAGSPGSMARLWGAASGHGLATLTGHTAQVLHAAFSPDGARVVTASADGSVRVWDAATGRVLAVLAGHTGGVLTATFSPDGTRVVTGGTDDTARVWDASSGRGLVTFGGHDDEVFAAAFSAGGDRVITGSLDGTARLWDVVSGRLLTTFSGLKYGPRAVSFSPDGSRAVTGDHAGEVRVWDTASGHLLRTINEHTNISAVAFSPDGGRIVAAEGDKTATVWDVASGRRITTLEGLADTISAVSFTPDGARIVTGRPDDTVREWDAVDGHTLALFVGSRHWMRTAALSADGTRVATEGESGSRWPWDTEAVLWSAVDGKALGRVGGRQGTILGASEGISLAFSSDGARQATGEGEVTNLWDAVTGQTLATLDGGMGEVEATSFSPDGQRLATVSDGVARIWDAKTGGLLNTLTQGPEKHFAYLPRMHAEISRPSGWTVAFSPNGTQLLTAGSAHDALIWDLATERVVTELDGHQRAVLSAAFSPDGTRIVTGSADDTARVWNALNGQTIATLAISSRDQKAGGRGGFWDLAPVSEYRSPVRAASFSPDGTRLITVDNDDSVRVWDESNGWRPTMSLSVRQDAMIGGASWSKAGVPLIVTCETRPPTPGEAPRPSEK
jgi:WD40 repeat protein